MTEVFSGKYVSNDETQLKMLEALVSDDNKVDPNAYSITNGAFNKAMTYAQAVGKIAGGGMECYGYLLKPIDSLDNTVTDIFFASDQSDSAAYVRVSEEGVYEASQVIEPRGLMIVGWWHSHGTMPTFHSGTDVRNFEKVLHSIAPITMYRTEKGAYTYNKEKKELLVNGVKLRGIEFNDKPEEIEVLKKVKQDPYAYSMVVNMNREYYLERISKSLNSRSNTYSLERPIHPNLNLVSKEEDVEFNVSEIEDDITRKVHLSHQREGEVKRNNYFPNKQGNEKLIEQFASKAIKSRSDFMRNYVFGIMNDSNNALQNTVKERFGFSVKLSDLEEKLKTKFADVAEKYCLEQSYDIQTLRDEINLHFIKDYVTKETEETYIKYLSFNSSVNNSFKKAISAGKALAKYSMERYTDCDNKIPHKYRNFVTHFVSNLDTAKFISMDEAMEESIKNKLEKSTSELFLYHDRLKIINNLNSSMVFNKDNENYYHFLEEFSAEFENNPKSEKLDMIIEEGLIKLNNPKANLISFRDRDNYERKGVLPTILSGIGNYFAGGRNGRSRRKHRSY